MKIKLLVLLTILIILPVLAKAASVYTLNEQWVECGNGAKLLDPYYSSGVTFSWDGPSKDGKANGYGTAKKFVHGELESTYIGEYRNGIREGKGKFTHKDGSTKTGTFINGQLIGQGSMDSDDGHTYQGEFINYRMHGNGKLKMANGTTFEGFFVSDNPYTGKLTFYDGTIVFLQSGEPVEKIIEANSSYSPKIGKRLTEYFDSEWKRCDAKNATFYRVITYEAPHKPKGVVKDFYMNGKLQGEGTYAYIDYSDEGKNFQEGKLIIYHKNGKKQCDYTLLNNNPNGPQYDYYENGEVRAETNFIRGVREGSAISYYPNNNPETIAIYENGILKNNKYLKFSEDGESCYLIYNEDFERNKDSWGYNGPNGTLAVNANNTISFDVTPGRSVSGGIYADFSPTGNNIIEVTTLQNSSKDVIVGFLFGYKDWENYCGFYISGNQYTFAQVKNGKNITNYDWMYSPNIKPDLNTLSVYNVGNELGFSLNGEDLGVMPRPRYDGGFCVITVINNGLDMAQVDAGNLSILEVVENPESIAQYLPLNPNDDWKGSGSGFFLDERGYLATNYHVVNGMKDIQVSFVRNGQIENHPATVIKSDKENDVSILRIDDTTFTPMPQIPYNLITSIKDTGSEVFTLGYPMAIILGEEVKLTDGKISSKSGPQGDQTVYQISVPIQPGNSGGPLFDTEGNIVGITSAFLNRDYYKAENVNFAIKSSYLKNLVDNLPMKINIPSSVALKDLPLTEKIKKIEPYMILIKVK